MKYQLIIYNIKPVKVNSVRYCPGNCLLLQNNKVHIIAQLCPNTGQDLNHRVSARKKHNCALFLSAITAYAYDEALISDAMTSHRSQAKE